MYDFMRRPSMAFDPNVLREVQQQHEQQRLDGLAGIPPNESPMTPLPENLQNYEIDDEFNVPISVAIVMLLSYMLFGAALYCILENNWSFFEAFYFVFISISTIGMRIRTFSRLIVFYANVGGCVYIYVSKLPNAIQMFHSQFN